MKLRQMARRHAEFKVFLQNQASQPSAEQQAASDEIQRRAIYHGEWQPYIHSLQTQGMHYARAGLSFPAWFEVVSAFRKYMKPHLLGAYGTSPKRLSAALNGIDVLFDFAMSVIGESYLETKQQLIQQQGQTIQQGQSQLAGIINSAMDAIITMDENQRILIFNPAAEKMFQRFADKVVGQPLTMLIPERLRPNHQEDVRGFGKTSITKRSMGRLGMVFGLRANGEEFPLEVSISQIEIEGRKTFTAILRDITERQQAEEALERGRDDLEIRVQERTAALSESNALLQMLLDYSPDHIFFKDLQSRFIRTSRSQAQALGLSDPAEIVGKSDFDFFAHAQRSYEDEQEIIRFGEPLVGLEEHVVWPDGRETWGLTTKVPLRDTANNIIGTFGIYKDITQRKQAEEALQKAELELEATIKELEAFSYSVSHDLRALCVRLTVLARPCWKIMRINSQPRARIICNAYAPRRSTWLI